MTTEISKGDARRIGIFGGTFNPIHQGHLKAAREVATALDLECVVFVPSANPPHKTDLAHDPIAPATDRMRWVEACVDGIADFEVNGLELERAGASYSIDTLTSVTKELAPARLFFILGYDAFIEMGTWRAPGEILELVDLVVMSRPPADPGHLGEWLPEFARDLVDIAEDGKSAANKQSDTHIFVLNIDALPISASQIRIDLANGNSIAAQVPEQALDEIVSSGHYGGPRNSAAAANDAEQTEEREENIEEQVKGNPVEAAQSPPIEPMTEQLRAKLGTVLEAALERNGQEPIALDVRKLTSYTDCVVVVTGNSNRQLLAISESIVTALKHTGDHPLGTEGSKETSWVLIDANDVVVHVFEPDSRELFDIEGLWGDAPRVELNIPDAAPSDTATPVPAPTA
jgi:nicotinate-nucleotide adenylyltransferase